MKHRIIFGILLTTLTGCGSDAPGGNQTSATAANRDLTPHPATETVDAFHKALTEGDTKEALVLLANDVLIYESGGAETSKAEYASHHLEADMAFLKGVKQSVSARSAQVNGGVAWVTSQGKTIGTYKGKAINSASTETMVLRLIDGTWKIVHIHWSSGDNKPSKVAS